MVYCHSQLIARIIIMQCTLITIILHNSKLSFKRQEYDHENVEELALTKISGRYIMRTVYIGHKYQKKYFQENVMCADFVR